MAAEVTLPRAAEPAPARRNGHGRTRWLVHLALIASCLLVTGPILFALIKATQAKDVVLSASLVPGSRLLDNVRAAWTGGNLADYMRNSLIISVAVTVGKTILSLMSGMALVYFKFRLKPLVFGFILLTLMMPTEVLIVGLFDVVSMQPPPSVAALLHWISHPLEPTPYGFGWSNTYWAIIVPFLASATGTFLFRQHFMSIPGSLADAAKIDGAGPLRFLWSVLVPMSWNTIGALAVIQFVYVWNQYLWPLVIIRDDDKQVVQVGLNLLIAVGQSTDWGKVLAGALIALVPPLVVFVLLQEQFMRGFALSAEK